MSNPRSLADFTISRIAARSAFPDRAAVLSIRLVREFTPDIFSIITGPSWLTRISHSASYTVPRIDPAALEYELSISTGRGDSPGLSTGVGRGAGMSTGAGRATH